VFGRRRDEVFLKLKALLEPFGITQYEMDDWGADTRHIDPRLRTLDQAVEAQDDLLLQVDSETRHGDRVRHQSVRICLVGIRP
jgi:hypothetical protein